MANVLAVLEQRGGTLKRVSHETLTAARTVADASGAEVHALVIGASSMPVDELGGFGADKVLVAGDPSLADYQADRYAAVAAGVGEYGAVIIAATAMGKDLAPRIAARLGCALAADVTDVRVDDGIIVTRPVYAGKANYALKVTASRCVISVRPNAVSAAANPRDAAQESVEAPGGEPRARTVEVKQPERAALDVAEASVVVSGGRGLKGPENFAMLDELAAALGGAVGASRAVVDAGWRPHAEQVGQTGKVVSPNLYVAVGISGAIQHLAGIRTAKTIVAINKDPDAPIFKVADYGIVGDLFEVVPRLTEEIRKAQEG
jgi:electron transfer flavoprotein alpha subunit